MSMQSIRSYAAAYRNIKAICDTNKRMPNGLWPNLDVVESF